MMSRYPIGHSGWGASFTCPSLLTGTWGCIAHAKTVDGDQSFWKVFWRWGEDYSGASVTVTGPNAVDIAYSSTATGNFVQLW